MTVKAFEITWINSTSAQVELAAHNKSANMTLSGNVTFKVFPTSRDATNYLNAMNKTAYSLASTVYESGGIYQMATGHAPQIYREYQWNEGSPLNISEFTLHEIFQADNTIQVGTVKILS